MRAARVSEASDLPVDDREKARHLPAEFLLLAGRDEEFERRNDGGPGDAAGQVLLVLKGPEIAEPMRASMAPVIVKCPMSS